MTTTAATEHADLAVPVAASAERETELREVARLGEAIDTILEVEAAIRRLTAYRTVLIDSARRQVPAAEAALLYPASAAAKGPELSAREDLAERAFVADPATALLLPETTARAMVEDARTLVHDLPTTLAALGKGSVSYRHAQVMVEHTAGLDPEAAHAVEAAGLARASSTTPTGLARRLRRARERVQPESVQVRHRRAATERRVRLDRAADGMSWLTAFLPAVTAEAIMDRIDHATSTLATPDEQRTHDQLRADVLAGLLLDGPEAPVARALDVVAANPVAAERIGRNADPAAAACVEAASVEDTDTPADDAARLAALARSLTPRVAVTVPVLTLLGRGDEPGELAGYGPIDPDTARTLAASAPSFTRILVHPHTGAVLDVGRESYAVPADLRRHLAVRDGTCRFPGCGRRATACDVDHLVAYTDSGTTSADNLVHLCRHHHRLKHETAWWPTLSADPGAPPGTVTWISPTGRTHATAPATTNPPVRANGTGDGARAPGADPDEGPPPF
ncbi:DUF222 domain-containing protein [Luteimicrobium sp. DT211]|uniref:HNH endonuclease signature motif containing protein n=1 Tax=Luteimicrobium sp. DT211 TaxID=3393412 RepID=UPI003CE8B9FB